jgi:hypothetical protein
MNILETTVKAISKRPLILIIIGAVMLVAATVNAFIPIMAMIMGIINITGGGIFESVLSILQMLIDPAIIPTVLLLLAVLILLGSVLAGLLMPGYLLIVGDGIAEGRKKPGLFTGNTIKKYFLDFFLRTLKTLPCAAALVMFLMVASVPAIVVTKAAFTTRPGLLIAALFVDFITVGVIFLCLSFFKAYVYMWYIAAVNGEPKPFLSGKAAADKHFWQIAFSMLAFDIIFVVVIFVIYLSKNQIFRYAAGWVFTTGFFSTLAVYLVRTYGKCAAELQDEAEQGEIEGNLEENSTEEPKE